ncbi:MAG: glucoamylase family protein [Gemmatimonadaceae bacterium]
MRRRSDAATRGRATLLAGAFAVLSALSVSGCRTPTAPRAGAPPAYVATPSQSAFLDTVQRRTFDWFWETTNPANGLVPDRWPTKSFSSIASVGFGLTAYLVGAEHGWITREQARDRVLTTLRFFWTAPQGGDSANVTGHRGFFYHFVDMERGLRFQRVELSTIDTGLLLMGVLACRQYFDRAEPADSIVRALADSIYFRVDWPWARDAAASLTMGWHPERGFITSRWIGYDEAMLLYALALGSPTHPLGPEAWDAWTATYKWDRFHGQEYVMFAPLFGHQYSHVWIDFRGIQDGYMRTRGIDYFENSRRATLAHRAYAIANPGGWRAYSDSVWGLTASDGPLDSAFVVAGRRRQFHTYWARGAGTDEINDDGTLVPTAAGGSVPFAPEIAIPALLAMRRTYGDPLFTRYGFVDAFNPTLTDASLRVSQGRIVPGVGWFDTDHLGIDQGPILLMIENHRTEFVWRLLRGNPHIVRGLCRAGFSGGWLSGRCS